jgi:catechol 2,3-dioxygenase
MTTVALDVRNLVAMLGDRRGKDFAGLPPGTVMGHVHLQVASIPDTVGFYRDVLGLELMLGLGDSAAFFAAGGYHHHVGANTWHSRGAAPPGPGRAALRHATIMFPDTAERDRVAGRVEETGAPTSSGSEGVLVRDPSGVPLLLTV